MNNPNNNPNTTDNANADAAAPSRPLDIPGAVPFGQPRAAAPVARPANFYGGYPVAGEASASAIAGRKLVIGEGITLAGEIEACDHLVIEGTVEAALKGASVLDVAQTGVFYGAVEIDEATIAGRFEGDLTVNGRLTVRSTGSVIGTISYKELSVEAGALVEGKISPACQSRSKDASNNKGSKPNNPQPSGNKGREAANLTELPFTPKAAASGE